MNEIDATIEGWLPGLFEGMGISKVVTDPDRNRVYALASNLVIVYRDAMPAFTAVYRLDEFAIGAVRRLAVTEDALFVALEDEIIKVRLGDLAQNLPDNPCVRDDVSGLNVPGTMIQLTCSFGDAVYDVSRNRIYVAFPGKHGPSGNAIAVIEPSTNTIERFIPVGAEPGKLRLSTDDQLLYVTLPEASKVVAIDLGSQAIQRSVPLGFSKDVNGNAVAPYFPEAAVPMP